MRSKGKKNMVPTKAKYKSNVKALAPAKFLEQKRLRGIIGSRVRPSTTKKAPNATTPITRDPRTSGFPKPTLEDSRSPKTTLPKPAAASAAPSRSSLLASGSRLSGTCERVIARTAIASGMLMKKTPRQETFSAR
jgi:hypothetical protein